jgi:subtilisin family serine protease
MGALVALLMAAGGLVAAPAEALLPSLCYLAPEVSTPTALVAYDAAHRSDALRAVSGAGGTVVGGIPAIGAVQVSFPSAAALDAALPRLRTAPGVREAQAERTHTAHKSPKDPFLSYQWGLYKVGAPKAWDRETGTKNPVVVAVIDTGVDLQHPDLLGHVQAGKNVVANNDDPRDDNSHGTHVAGIIAASTNNKVGVSGMSWGATILAVKVLGADGSGSDCDVALGIVSAADAGAKVLNLSLGAESSSCGGVMQLAVNYARDKGSMVVVSAGNGAKKGNKPTSPANCDGVLAVGATDSRDKIAPFSTNQPYVGVSAPGVAILSTYFNPRTGKRTYEALSGTSMAAPMVSGLAALLMSKNPTWTGDQVQARIVSTSQDLGPKGRDRWFGVGRINAARALS